MRAKMSNSVEVNMYYRYKDTYKIEIGDQDEKKFANSEECKELIEDLAKGIKPFCPYESKSGHTINMITVAELQVPSQNQTLTDVIGEVSLVVKSTDNERVIKKFLSEVRF
jgi:hypothetical protein